MSEKKIIVEMSARHVHVTESDLEILFGKGASLTPKQRAVSARSVSVRGAR